MGGNMKIFFTADCHFYHANIIKYANRPFLKEGDLINNSIWASEDIKTSRVELMNKEIIKRWNFVVKENDLVYHLGDFAFRMNEDKLKSLENQLNGKIIHFVGNHDRNNSVKSYLYKAIMRFGGRTVLAQHHPPNEYELEASNCDFAICGHVHNKWKFKFINKIPVINVGIDVWDYRPISTFSLLKFYKKIKLGR